MFFLPFHARTLSYWCVRRLPFGSPMTLMFALVNHPLFLCTRHRIGVSWSSHTPAPLLDFRSIARLPLRLPYQQRPPSSADLIPSSFALARMLSEMFSDNRSQPHSSQALHSRPSLPPSQSPHAPSAPYIRLAVHSPSPVDCWLRCCRDRCRFDWFRPCLPGARMPPILRHSTTRSRKRHNSRTTHNPHTAPTTHLNHSPIPSLSLL